MPTTVHKRKFRYTSHGETNGRKVKPGVLKRDQRRAKVRAIERWQPPPVPQLTDLDAQVAWDFVLGESQ